MAKAWLGLFIATALLGGCTTTLQTALPNDESVSKGFKYRLPRLAYDATITRVVSHCPGFAGDPMTFDITATAASRITAGEEILIDYTAMANGAKTTTFEAHNFPSGVLKSVNVAVNDNTAAIVGEGVKAGVSIGKIAIGLGSGGVTKADSSGLQAWQLGPDEQTATYLRCSKATHDALASLPGLKKQTKDAADQAKKAHKDLSDLQDASKAGKPAPAKKLAELKAKADLADNAVTELNTATADANEALTVIQRVTLDIPDIGAAHRYDLAGARDGKTQPQDLFEIYVPGSRKGAYIGLQLTGDLKPDPDHATAQGYKPQDKGLPTTDLARVRTSILETIQNKDIPFKNELAQVKEAAVLALARRNPAPPTTPAKYVPDAQVCTVTAKDCGLIYRSPAPGRVRVCRGLLDTDGSEVSAASIDRCVSRISTDKDVLFNEDRAIPQFGGRSALPLKNKAFANNTLAATFTEDGQLVDMAYTKPTAETQGLLASVNQGLGGVTDLITFQNGKKLRDLKAQKDVYDAQLASDDARAKLTPTELRALQDKKSVVDAQIALAESQSKQQPSELTAVQNQTLLWQAQQTNIQAHIDLLKKEKELQALQTPSPTP